MADASWPGNVARLKRGGPVAQIYASFGGGDAVEDFATLQKIYEANGNSFGGTTLGQNFQALRNTFPAVGGIDMDCEDNYDRPSFVAFCRVLAGMGFGLTLCPYASEDFWTDALTAAERSGPGAVKWRNLQCYSGGAGNDPDARAQAVARALPGSPTGGFIVAGCAADEGPSQARAQVSGYAGGAGLGGGFIWNMDDILNSGYRVGDFVSAITDGMPRPPSGP